MDKLGILTHNAECFLVQLIIFLSNWYRLASLSDVHRALGFLPFSSWFGLKMGEVQLMRVMNFILVQHGFNVEKRKNPHNSQQMYYIYNTQNFISEKQNTGVK